jgi:hypothetical protein
MEAFCHSEPGQSQNLLIVSRIAAGCLDFARRDEDVKS